MSEIFPNADKAIHMKRRTLKDLEKIVGSLGKPSKMPGFSYGLPAQECKTGSKLHKIKGSVCENCYAMKNFYKTYAKTIIPAQYRRLEATKDPLWPFDIAELIQRKDKTGYFRWHDSGDIQDIDHLAKIVAVAKLLPQIKFWIPTREYSIVKQYLANSEFPDNLTVRISNHWKDKDSSNLAKITGCASGVTTDPNKATCPAWKQDNECLDCRACWDKSIAVIDYLEH